MQLRYVLQEGFSGFTRAKLSSTAAVITICISLLLLSLFAILFINAEAIVKELRNKVELEAFLVDQASDDDIARIKKMIEGIDGVQEVHFVSKEDAAKIFYEEFGEDIYKILNFNPLPASFKIYLKDGYKTTQRVYEIYYQIKALQGIDDVIYRKQLLELIDQRARGYLWMLFGIGIFVALSALLLVANTIRLAIYAKRDIIRTMKLIGATRRFIRTPFLIEGFLQGLLGGIIASAILYGVITYLEQALTLQMAALICVQPYYYGIIVCVGCLLGLFGSAISVRQFIKTTIIQ
ncbi:MAG: ABC transporter permease [Bacteroidetes bacterium]|nr:ABC transporter permease [Bacteroidota bacterium]